MYNIYISDSKKSTFWHCQKGIILLKKFVILKSKHPLRRRRRELSVQFFSNNY